MTRGPGPGRGRPERQRHRDAAKRRPHAPSLAERKRKIRRLGSALSARARARRCLPRRGPPWRGARRARLGRKATEGSRRPRRRRGEAGRDERYQVLAEAAARDALLEDEDPGVGRGGLEEGLLVEGRDEAERIDVGAAAMIPMPGTAKEDVRSVDRGATRAPRATMRVSAPERRTKTPLPGTMGSA
jgi:hypothetical protein